MKKIINYTSEQINQLATLGIKLGKTKWYQFRRLYRINKKLKSIKPS